MKGWEGMGVGLCKCHWTHPSASSGAYKWESPQMSCTRHCCRNTRDQPEGLRAQLGAQVRLEGGAVIVVEGSGGPETGTVFCHAQRPNLLQQ